VGVTYGTKPVSNFETTYPAVNLVTLIVQGDAVKIYVNSDYVTTMNISRQTNAGQVCIATALFGSHERKNEKMDYSDLYLWELP